MEYKFVKEKHQHFLDGKQLTGCTTVLGILAKPALISWSANMTAEFLKDKLDGIKKLDQANWELLLEEARKVHTKRKEKAGDYGTKIHEDIEKIINDCIDNNNGYLSESITGHENKSIQNFIDWTHKNDVKFLASEKNVYSEKLFLGGIVDFICEIDGQIWIGDIKTSKSGIYPENFAQIAGYQLMLNEMGLYPCIIGYIVLNLKETGEMAEKRSVSNGDNIKFFLACLEIYRQQEKLKNNIIA